MYLNGTYFGINVPTFDPFRAALYRHVDAYNRLSLLEGLYVWMHSCAQRQSFTTSLRIDVAGYGLQNGINIGASIIIIRSPPK